MSRRVEISSNATSDSGYDGGMGEQSTFRRSSSQSEGTSMNRADQARMNAIISSTSRANLNSETEGLILFDLTTKKGSKIAFSPNCIKTILDLKLLNIIYERERLTFHQIRNELASKVAENVTVPTLELVDGSHLVDSWAIAQFLHEKHPNGHLIFPNGSASKSYARMMEKYGVNTLGSNLRPLTRVQLAAHLDRDSKEYFENVKIGRAKMEKFANLTTSEKQKHVDESIAALEPIESALQVIRAESQAPAAREIWLEGGSAPSHVDFVLYCWFVYSQVGDKATIKQIWQAHPAVAKWIFDMNNWAGPEITNDYF